MQNLQNKTKEELVELANELDAFEEHKRYNLKDYIFPATGPYRRELYPKHMAFLNAQGQYRELVFVAARRVGKTTTGAYAAMMHLTGEYDEDYTGRRFTRPILCWVIGQTTKTTREILQVALMGDPQDIGSGMIPKKYIHKTYAMAGTALAYDVVEVKHKSGWINRVVFKSYDQHVSTFFGKHVDFAWEDEEAPKEHHQAVIMCTAQTNRYDPESQGIVMLTFTSEFGMTELIEDILRKNEDEESMKNAEMYITSVAMSDVPHMSPEEIEYQKKKCPPHLVKSRIYGEIGGGVSGAVFPFTEEQIICEPFEIPNYFERAYGFDSSFRGTAAIWGAYDPTRDIWYIYDEFLADSLTAPSVATILRAKPYMKWVEGVVDPAADKDISMDDGRTLFEAYNRYGLNLHLANNAFEAGINECFHRLQTGRCKFMTTCKGIIKDVLFYRRDEKFNIVKKSSYHRLDAWRYLMMSGKHVAKSEFSLSRPYKNMKAPAAFKNGRDTRTGY